MTKNFYYVLRSHLIDIWPSDYSVDVNFIFFYTIDKTDVDYNKIKKKIKDPKKTNKEKEGPRTRFTNLNSLFRKVY